MSGKKIKSFLKSDHEGMLNDLNEISKQYSSAKWYFLITIAALGFAYFYVAFKADSKFNLDLSPDAKITHSFRAEPKCTKPLLINGVSYIDGHLIGNIYGSESATLELSIDDNNKMSNSSIINSVISGISANKNTQDNRSAFFLSILVICLSGNIVFWLICEYVISHGFLFRYIQARLAKIEKIVYCNRKKVDKYHSLIKLTNDPTDISQFVKFNEDDCIKNQLKPCESNSGDHSNKIKPRLSMDHPIPDQFMPVYWASLLFILINTGVTCIILLEKDLIGWMPCLALFSIFGLSFISKIWDYYINKISSFINSSCNFSICINVHENKKISFFKFPCISYALFGLFGLFAIIYYGYLFYEHPGFNLISLYLLNIFELTIIGYFSPILLGVILLLLKNILLIWNKFEEDSLFSGTYNYLCPYVTIIKSGNAPEKGNDTPVTITVQIGSCFFSKLQHYFSLMYFIT